MFLCPSPSAARIGATPARVSSAPNRTSKLSTAPPDLLFVKIPPEPPPPPGPSPAKPAPEHPTPRRQFFACRRHEIRRRTNGVALATCQSTCQEKRYSAFALRVRGLSGRARCRHKHWSADCSIHRMQWRSPPRTGCMVPGRVSPMLLRVKKKNFISRLIIRVTTKTPTQACASTHASSFAHESSRQSGIRSGPCQVKRLARRPAP